MSDGGVHQVSLQPIEYMVFAGFQRRFQQVFNCPCAFIDQNDKTRVLERVFGRGNSLTYPYAWFEIQNMSHNLDSYNPNYMARRGLVTRIATDSSVQTVRILPTNFEVEVTYITNQFQSIDQGSVIAFIKRWLFARRMGYLKFSIDYGLLNFNINLTNSESVAVPKRDNITEAETKYEVKTSTIIHGYTSEPVLGIKGKVNQFNVQETYSTSDTQIVNKTYHSFNRN